VDRARTQLGDRKDHETGKTELSGGEADGVEAGELGFGEDGGDRISGAGQGALMAYEWTEPTAAESAPWE
jgi:hypothetical protein